MELDCCKRFQVFIHSLSMETIKLLVMMKDKFHAKFERIIWFHFGKEFKNDDFENLEDILEAKARSQKAEKKDENPLTNLFDGFEFNIIIDEDTKGNNIYELDNINDE